MRRVFLLFFHFESSSYLSWYRGTASGHHLRLQKADAPSFSSKQSSHQTKRNNKSNLQLGSSSNRCAPCLPNKKQIIYKPASSNGPNSGSGNLLKTGFAQQTSKNEPKQGPKMGVPGGPIFWDRMHRSVKNKRKKISPFVAFAHSGKIFGSSSAG